MTSGTSSRSKVFDVDDCKPALCGSGGTGLFVRNVRPELPPYDIGRDMLTLMCGSTRARLTKARINTLTKKHGGIVLLIPDVRRSNNLSRDVLWGSTCMIGGLKVAQHSHLVSLAPNSCLIKQRLWLDGLHEGYLGQTARLKHGLWSTLWPLAVFAIRTPVKSPQSRSENNHRGWEFHKPQNATSLKAAVKRFASKSEAGTPSMISTAISPLRQVQMGCPGLFRTAIQ